MKSSALVSAHPLRFQSIACSHQGKRRALNEDRVLDRPELGLWAVADGMGGHMAGDEAAQCVIEALETVDQASSAYGYLNAVLAALDRANASLFSRSNSQGHYRRMGTTLVTLIAYETHVACLWAGDSRGYYLRDGQLNQLTRDHSVVQQMIDEDIITESERQNHPQAHIITRAIGMNPAVEMDRRYIAVQPNDIFLICSDGLNACLAESEITEILSSSSLVHAADGLMTRALQTDAPDNLSFVLIGAAE